MTRAVGGSLPSNKLPTARVSSRSPPLPATGDDVDEASVNNVVLGQFEKVQRSKSKWKVVLKDCVLTLNGRDYLVRRCTGEMDF